MRKDREKIMSTGTVYYPYCSATQPLTIPGEHDPFYVNCPDCTRRFIVEPMQDDGMMFKEGEAAPPARNRSQTNQRD